MELTVNFSKPLRSTLAAHPLPWLLVQASAASATGALRLLRGKVRRVIYLLEGSPVYVDSNLRNETLGHYLVSRRVITEEQLASAMKEARATNQRLGETLVRLGIADQATVNEGLLGQVRLKLINALRWPDASLSFLPGDDFSARIPRCPVDAVELTLLVLKRLSLSPDLRARWEPELHRGFRLTPLGVRFRPAIERVFGSSRLRQILTGTALKPALAGAADPAGLMILLESLAVTGLGELGAAVSEAISLEAQPSPEPGGLRDIDPTLPRHDSGVTMLAELELCDPAELPPPHAVEGDSGEVSIPSVDELELEAPAAPALDPASLLPGPPSVLAPAPPGPPAPPLRLVEAGPLRDALQQSHPAGPLSFYQVLGVSPDASREEIEKAYRKTLARLSTAPAEGVALPLESQAADLAVVAEQAFAVLSQPQQRRSYDETLALAQVQPQPDPDAFGAELLFQEGCARLRERALEPAVKAFQEAVRVQPGQPDYHAFLGWSLFLLRGRGEAGALAARPHLEEALRIAPDSAQAHEQAARVELDAHNHAAAAEHFSQALQAGPPRLDIFELLRDLLLRLGELERLEQHYRQMIFRLRDANPLATVPLWLELANLYSYRLAQPDNARVALEVAAKMAPRDLRVQQANAALQAATCGDWRRQADDERRRFLAAPEEVGPLRELARFHLAGGRTALARDALALLAHRAAARADELALLARLRPPSLPRASRPLSTAELEALLGVEPSPVVLSALTALASPLARLAPLDFESQAREATGEPISMSPTSSFTQVLTYVCDLLRAPVPRVYRSRSLGARALPVAGEQPVLVVGRTIEECQDEATSAAAIAAGVACLPPGRCLLLTRPVEDLKDIVMAGLSLFNPAMRIPPGSRAEAWRGALEGTPEWRQALGGPLQRLIAARRVNLSHARRSVKGAAARLALLAGADLGAAMRLLEGEAGLGLELAGFALGDEYERLRRALGLLA